MERFIAILIEHFAGAFPLWFAPVQATVLPIADRHVEYAAGVRAQLAEAGLRVDLDARQEKINYKIRGRSCRRCRMLVIGDREAADGAVAVHNCRRVTSAPARSGSWRMRLPRWPRQYPNGLRFWRSDSGTPVNITFGRPED
jgi:threonyl-tRNA synthetase